MFYVNLTGIGTKNVGSIHPWWWQQYQNDSPISNISSIVDRVLQSLQLHSLQFLPIRNIPLLFEAIWTQRTNDQTKRKFHRPILPPLRLFFILFFPFCRRLLLLFSHSKMLQLFGISGFVLKAWTIVATATKIFHFLQFIHTVTRFIMCVLVCMCNINQATTATLMMTTNLHSRSYNRLTHARRKSTSKKKQSHIKGEV